MDPTTQRLFEGAAGAGGEVLGIEDVFSTWLYTGNGGTQTITNGIDLAGEGGMVWVKNRSSTDQHVLTDTVRGAGATLSSDRSDGEFVNAAIVSAFGNTGFSVGSSGAVNTSSQNYASWTFRKAEKFFDVVTFTKTSLSETFSHNLGATPGCILLKRTDSTGSWLMGHAGAPGGVTGGYLLLNTTQAFVSTAGAISAITDTTFTLGGIIATGGTFVAYLFAHDAGGFGDSGNDSVVSCGSYTGNGSTTGPTVTLGWEPQWLLVKRASGGTGDWALFDSMRGVATGGDDEILYPNLSNAGFSSTYLDFNATGFQLTSTSGTFNASGSNYIYIAIRRGPMKTPEDATTVFSALTATVSTGTVRTTGFPIDLQLVSNRPQNAQPGHFYYDRLRGVSTTDAAGGTYLNTTSSAAENTNIAMTRAFTNTGFTDAPYLSGYSAVWWNFRRAPGFFDVVTYTGTGVARTVPHNLGVAPELVITKKRSAASNWAVNDPSQSNPWSGYLRLSQAAAFTTASAVWNNTAPTSTLFSVGTLDPVNAAGQTYIAYLFATCPGVSKVGSYTGTAGTQQIDCGFTAGARFVLIKRTDSTGDWYVWDSARGITAGNDPYLLLNSTAAEVTSTDYIDPLSTGFEITSTAPAAINASGGSFVFLAVA